MYATILSTLRIEDVKTARRLGEAVLRSDGKTKQLWRMVWNESPEVKNLISLEYGRIYLIVRRTSISNEILKIGKSECRGGMKTTFSFYQGGLGGSPSLRTFGIHHLIHDELQQGNRIEIHGIWTKPVNVMVPGLFGQTEEMVCPSIHSMEDKCRCEYRTIYGNYPPWNFQESGIPWPEKIAELYKQQVQTRGKQANDEEDIADAATDAEDAIAGAASDLANSDVMTGIADAAADAEDAIAGAASDLANSDVMTGIADADADAGDAIVDATCTECGAKNAIHIIYTGGKYSYDPNETFTDPNETFTLCTRCYNDPRCSHYLCEECNISVNVYGDHGLKIYCVSKGGEYDPDENTLLCTMCFRKMKDDFILNNFDNQPDEETDAEEEEEMKRTRHLNRRVGPDRAEEEEEEEKEMAKRAASAQYKDRAEAEEPGEEEKKKEKGKTQMNNDEEDEYYNAVKM